MSRSLTLLGLVVHVGTAAPATAQEGLDGLMSPEQQAELYCVYDMLSQTGEAASIAGVFVDPEATDADIEGADAILSDAIDECR
mgnify:CR=1 FL=1